MTQLVTEYFDRAQVRHRARDFDEHVSDSWPRGEQHGPACQHRRLELRALNFDDEVRRLQSTDDRLERRGMLQTGQEELPHIPGIAAHAIELSLRWNGRHEQQDGQGDTL